MVFLIPISFQEESFIKDSNENEYCFLLTGVITQNKFFQYSFYMSDYINDRYNNTWFSLSTNNLLTNNGKQKFTWAEMWGNMISHENFPIVLLYVRLF